MKFALGVLISFLVGVGCRYFDIPVGSPPVLPGALLVVAMTLGYSFTNTVMLKRGKAATTAHLCGGPTGQIPSTEAAANEGPIRRSAAVSER